ncbi:MAG TPA: helix-turn-helix domain-containing protein [Gemmatimonadaceae bacterium]|nr:helix-turn-helix domain-containing protein [Gemmatimonadaceae bacterium]
MPLNARFMESTRGRILSLLRIGPHTVEELRSALELTDNAVRPHLVALERDGLVRQVGTRRGEGAGKPAVLYEMTTEAEPLLSRAYAPVLAALLEVLEEELPSRESRKVLRATGRRLAASVGGRAPGDLHARAQAAAAVLTALGGSVQVEERRGGATLRGVACPLATAVSRNPQVCHAVETLVGEVAGADATECCDRTGRPRCCFELKSA